MAYPFDPKLKHHLLIGLGLALWIFAFLYFTEPLDVSVFSQSEKLLYLPGYGLIGGVCYLVFLPFQYFLYKRTKPQWFLWQEAIFLLCFCVFAITVSRIYYLTVIMANDINPYTLGYMLSSIYLPALTTILPIIIIARYAFGKYKNKKLEATKIEIKGEGQYEGLKLFQDDLICIKSSDNYIEVFYQSGTLLKKTLIRNKLSKIDEEFEDILRTHRSYLINPLHFQQWKTENGKRFAQMSHNILLPVSKTYQDSISTHINSATRG
ncbi:LytTR family DNA-binding domain-containing protein [Winogradskyella maritima]|uniref:LytTR family DNA-binding domain-containing protein n=1 Tax=Winogradskyella maritima TaxID=1517766 RepID=A0ABV8AK10_9FLAO|nr:LytTR family DNA-binding domain-containing protein [Winogradskyella maritima]